MKQNPRDHMFKMVDDFETPVKWLLREQNIDFCG
jgi:hypothetical protein